MLWCCRTLGIISAFVARPVATADFTGMGVRPGEKAAATPADTIMRELFIGPDFSLADERR